MAITKTEGQFWTMVQVASNTVKKSSAVDVKTTPYETIGVNVWVGKDHTSAFTEGFDVVLQGRRNSSGTTHWIDLMPLGFVPTTASEEEAITDAPLAAGSSTIAVASTTNLAAADKILIKENSTPANSEFHNLVSVVTNTSVTIMDTTENQQGTGTTSKIYDNAVFFSGQCSIRTVEAVRLVCKSWNTGQTYMTEAEYILQN